MQAMKQIAVTLLVTLVSTCPAAGRSRPLPQPRQLRQPDFHRFLSARDDNGPLTRVRLKNGLTAIVEEHHTTPLAAVIAFVEFGRRHEPSPGVAEILADLLGQEVAARIRARGGTTSISVGPFSTTIGSVLPDRNAVGGLEAYRQLFVHDFENEELVRLVSRQVELSRQDRLSSPLARALSPAEESASESKRRPLPVTKELLQKTAAEFYQVGKMTLVTSGAVRRTPVLAEIVHQFAAIEPPKDARSGSLRRQNEAPEGGGSFEYSLNRIDVTQPYVILSYPIPSRRHPDFKALEMLRIALTGGQAGLLELPVGEAFNPPPYRVSSRIEQGADPSRFVITIEPDEGRIDAAEIRVLALLEALKREGIPGGELDRVRGLSLLEYYGSLETLQQRAELLACHEVAGSYLDRDKVPDVLFGVTAGKLKDVLTKYFDRANLLLQEILPREGESRNFTTQSYKETLEILLDPEIEQQAALLESLEHERNEKPLMKTSFKSRYQQSDFTRSAILRGPDIFVKRRHIVPLIHLGLFFSGGRINETEEIQGITEVGLQSFRYALSRRQEGRWLHRFERRGSRLELVNEPDYFGFLITTLPANLDQVLNDFVKFLREPRLTDIDVTAGVQTIRHRKAAETDSSPEDWAPLQALFFGTHPYGLNRYGTDTSQSRFTREGIQSWMATQIEKVHPYIIALGDLQGTGFLQGFVSLLSDRSYQVRPGVKKAFAPPETNGPSYRVEQVLKDRLRLGFIGPEAGTYSLDVMRTVRRLLSGLGGQLDQRLRRLGLARRVSILPKAEVNGGLIRVDIETTPEKRQSALDEVRKTVQEFDVDSLGQADFFNALVGSIAEAHREPESSVALVKTTMKSVLAGQSVQHRQQYLDTVQRLRPSEVVSVAHRFLTLGGEQPQ